MKADCVTVDVREDIRLGKEPFSRIMATVAKLKNDQGMLLVAPFEPVPLYAVLAQQGFSHESKTTEAGDWEILFQRLPDAAAATSAAGAVPKRPGVIEIDARGLEPPQPLVAILEALSNLPSDGELYACTDRRPMHLYPLLEKQGLSGETLEQPDGSLITHICRHAKP